jgi:hypothetical protein
MDANGRIPGNDRANGKDGGDAMPKSYHEILETFPGNRSGRSDAWDAVRNYAGIVVGQRAQDRFAVGVRPILNEVGQQVYAVVLVERASAA